MIRPKFQGNQLRSLSYLRAVTIVMERVWQPLQHALQRIISLQQDDSPALWTGHIFNVDLAFRPRQFYVQGVLLGVLMVFLLGSLLGRVYNRWVVKSWHLVYARALETEFSQVGIDTSGIAPKLIWNGADEACLFATGRRGVDSFHAVLTLRPWHDPFMIIFSIIYDIFALPASPWFKKERVTLTFTLPRSPRVNGGTFAIIDKTELHQARHERFDMKFARVSDGANASQARDLDERFAIASEAGNITDRWLGEIGSRGDKQRARIGITEALNSSAGQFLVSLLFTDQPRVEPATGPVPEAQRIERLELTLRLPRTEAEAKSSLPLLTLALDIADALSMTASGRSDILALHPDTYAALKKTRTEVAAQLEEISSRDAKAQEAEEAEEERRRLQQEKFDKLSPAEQAKVRFISFLFFFLHQRMEIAKRRTQRKAHATQMKRR